MTTFLCVRCDHRWVPRLLDSSGRVVAPVQCPKCHSPYWNKPRMTKTERAELVARKTRAYHRKRRADGPSTDGSKA